jgi:diacylglycerol kinase family enzyme
MRVTLLHNKSAGSENHAADEIESAVQRAGHEIVATFSSQEDLISSIRAHPCELIAIAGGDGTVSRTACSLAGCRVPLTILPLGTANNTALHLGLQGTVEELVQRWSSGRLAPFDLATVSAGDTLAPFSEAMGWGIFPAVIGNANRLSEPDEPVHTLERDRKVFQAVIEEAEPRSYAIWVDGVSVTGKFLLVEIANIPLIGPQLAVSPESDSSDGMLELVVAGESERPALIELALTGRVASDVRLRTLRGKHFTVETEDMTFHRDGSLVERRSEGAFSISVEPASVSYLLDPKRG